MGGIDKGGLVLGGRRLIDHVVARLAPQADKILIAGRHDYGTGLTALADHEFGLRGPAAGLWSALQWVEKSYPAAEGFFSVPADGPFLPPDLFDRLYDPHHSAIASDGTGVHPTFAYWRCDALREAISTAPEQYGFPLKELANRVHAKIIAFENANAFININSPDDMKIAEEILRR